MQPAGLRIREDCEISPPALTREPLGQSLGGTIQGGMTRQPSQGRGRAAIEHGAGNPVSDSRMESLKTILKPDTRPLAAHVQNL